MLTTQINTVKPHKEIYKLYLRKLFAGSNTELTNFEFSILGEMKVNGGKWNSKRLKSTLNTSYEQLNNYKKKLLTKQCITKTNTDDFIINPSLNIFIDPNETEFRFTFYVTTNEGSSTEKDIQGTSSQV
jgi:hypothetical protein